MLHTSVLLLITERALFFLSLCVVFNIRDMDHDRLSNVRTIPSIYGVNTAILAGLSGIVATGICTFLLFLRGTYSAQIVLAVFTSLVITFLLILKCKKGSNETYYLLGLDGMLPLQLMIVCLFNLF